MKRCFLLATFLCAVQISFAADNHVREQGTIVRMRITGCISSQHAVMDTLSGTGRMRSQQLCPEYVLVTDKLVYVIIGKASGQLLPLAQITRFYVQNNEVVVRVGDSHRETHFRLKEMMMREKWERMRELETGTLETGRPSESGCKGRGKTLVQRNQQFTEQARARFASASRTRPCRRHGAGRWGGRSGWEIRPA